MNMLSASASRVRARLFALLAAILSSAIPASAQVAVVTQKMQWVESLLVAVSVTLVTIAIIWAGSKMVFQGARLQDVAGILIGAICISGASAFASTLVG